VWDDILEELAPQYPDVASERQHCDAALMNMVRWPEKFDVIVASNLFGDLLTDLGGLLGGGSFEFVVNIHVVPHSLDRA